MEHISLNPMQEGSTVSRLSRETRVLAEQYLTGKFGGRIKDNGFRIRELDLAGDTPSEIIHGKLACLIAERSTLDILPEERLAGSASNLQGVCHLVPGWSGEGCNDAPVSSISHTTVDFGDAVRKGLKGLEKEIKERQAGDSNKHHQDFFNGLLYVIEAMRIWINRYKAAYREMIASPGYADYRENLSAVLERIENVPENPPATFAEALQSFWSFFEFQRLCGNWSGLGRFDEILGPYLEKDLESGIITLDEARELIAHFWIKGTEWCFGLRKDAKREPGSGDAQYYQNIILGGIDRNGRQIENSVTYLVLDVIEELHISDYPVTVRLNPDSPEKLLRRTADVQLLGGGIVSVYNEPLIISSLTAMGFSAGDARTFTNDGCWEIILPGQTNFSYFPHDYLIPFQEALFEGETAVSFDELYSRFLDRVRVLADNICRIAGSCCFAGKKSPGDYPDDPLPNCDVVLSLLEPSCRESGCSYSLHGTRFTMRAIHMAGLPDVANSLYAIQKNVFEKKIVSLAELVRLLKENWKDAESLRQCFANSLAYYGNDNQEVDDILRKVLHDCAEITREMVKAGYIMTPVGVSTFGREIAFAEKRMATSFGKYAHEYLAPNLSPTPGTDKSPLTSVINSYCRMDFTVVPNGCPLDLRLAAGTRQSSCAAENLANILKVFIEKGGLYLQIDVVDPEMLRQAQKDPDRFPNLVVRISGWSARFASLNEEWQNLIIRRAALGML